VHRPGGPLGEAGFECRGPLQDNHGFDRGYARGNLCWDPSNGFSGCASANFYAKFHREEWHDYLRSKWGVARYEEVRQTSLRGPRPDYDQALAMLSDRRKERVDCLRSALRSLRIRWQRARDEGVQMVRRQRDDRQRDRGTEQRPADASTPRNGVAGTTPMTRRGPSAAGTG